MAGTETCIRCEKTFPAHRGHFCVPLSWDKKERESKPTMDLDTFYRHYVICAVWSEPMNREDGDDSSFLDNNMDEENLAPETRAEMREDCRRFIEMATADGGAEAFAGWNVEQAGHDFWLTRNGHGAGFWDRYYGETPEARRGDALTRIAKTFGDASLYLGDDGMIYQM